MKTKTEQEKLYATEAPQLGKDLEYNQDNTKMDLTGCTYMIPLRVETVSYTHLTLPTILLV